MTISREGKVKPQTGRKYLKKNHLVNGLLSKLYKELLKFNEKGNQTDTSSKRYKDVLYHILSGKCKFKQQ